MRILSGAPEVIFNSPFEVEHIVPPGRGGSDNDSNLALSCRSCNLHKSDHIEAVDPLTGNIVSLFNPRRDRWEEHFPLDQQSATWIGLTAIGRATIERLQSNGPIHVVARRQWMRLKLFPA